MKLRYLILIGLFSLQLSAQTEEKEHVKQTIEAFFKAFHEQDSLALKDLVHATVTMQSIAKNKDGIPVLTSSQFSQFLKSIVSIPTDRSFEEKILDYTIKIDGAMANAWTPFEFWYDGKLSHCGVNSFQLIKEEEQWKIFYIVDTRRKECGFD